MKILDYLSPQAVKAPLEATDKQGVIFELIDLLASASLIRDPESLKQVVWEREQQRTTGIGEGLAIPHGKSNCSDQLVIAAGRPREPIDFEAVDRKPVRLVILLASPPDRTAQHIQALGTISRLWVSDPVFREQAASAATAAELFGLFKNAEA